MNFPVFLFLAGVIVIFCTLLLEAFLELWIGNPFAFQLYKIQYFGGLCLIASSILGWLTCPWQSLNQTVRYTYRLLIFGALLPIVIGIYNEFYHELTYFVFVDIWAIAVFTSPILFYKKKYVDTGIELYYRLGCIAAVLSLGSILLSSSLTIDNLRRNQLDDFLGLIFIAPYLVAQFSHSSNSRKIAFVLVIVIYIIARFLLTKRLPLLEIALVGLITFYYSFTWRDIFRGKMSLFASLSVLTILLSPILLFSLPNDVLDRYIKRIYTIDRQVDQTNSILDTVTANYRIAHEAKLVTENKSFVQVIFGQGAASTIEAPNPDISVVGRVSLLHLGLFTLLLKGGILMVFIWYFYLFNGLRISRSQSGNQSIFIVSLVILILSPLQTLLSTSLVFPYIMIITSGLYAKA